MYSNYYCFSKHGKYYAIDTVRIIPLQLKKETYDYLVRMNHNTEVDIYSWDEDEGVSDIKVLAKQNILFHNEEYKINKHFDELSISLIPTLACNLCCRYCYSKRKEEHLYMSRESVRETMEFFCKNYSFSICRIDFVGGGEPLYDIEKLVHMVDIIDEVLCKYNKKSLFWLCSNGLLLNDKILQYLDDRKFNLGISIDGPEIINDMNRIDLVGKGTYRKVISKVAEIQKNVSLSRNIRNLWNCAVITSKTRSLVEVMKHSYQLGFKNLQMKMVWSNDEDLRLSVENTVKLYDELTRFLYELIKQGKLEEFLCICNENDTYGKVLLRIIIQSGVTRRCNAGVNKFSISPEGKIYPCDSFMGIDSFCLGDIYIGFNELFYGFCEMRNTHIEKCKDCWARYICGGDCFYHAYINTGSPWVPDDQVCYIMKEISRLCISLVVDLYQDFPQQMKRLYAILSKRTRRMEYYNEKE